MNFFFGSGAEIEIILDGAEKRLVCICFYFLTYIKYYFVPLFILSIWY